MLGLVSNIYICRNISNCSAAASHSLFNERDVPDKQCPSCGKTLEPAKSQFNPTKALSLLAVFSLVLVSSYFIYNKLNPELLTDVTFVQPLTKANESDAIANVEIKLTAPQNHALVVQYETSGGTAEPHNDFTEQSGELFFAAGELSKTISVTIIPDRFVIEANETFYIKLVNVKGQPSHTVVIVEEGVDKDLLNKSDMLASTLSGIAADIANDIATIKMLEQYMKTTLSPAAEIEQRYQQAKVNIVNARERYLLLFNDALNIDPTVLIAGIDNRIAVLDREGFEHQYKATLVVKMQLTEFIESRIPNTDKWLQQLGEVVVIEDAESSTDPLLSI